MNWDRLRQLLAAALVGSFLGLVVGLKWPCPQPKAVSQPALELHTYNVILADGSVTAFKGTHITTGGFCTQVWVGNILDTNVCIAHVITEAYEEGEEEPKENERRS